MKILPVLKETKIYSNVKTTYYKFNEAQERGSKIANRAASMYRSEERLGEYKRAMKIRQTKKEITPYNLPILGLVAGTLIPVPGTTPVLTVICCIISVGMIAYDKSKNLIK